MNTTELRASLVATARSEGLDLAVLFGSTARGEPGAEDLDIALRGKRPLDLIALTNRLTVALGREDVDLVDLRVADPVLLMRVAHEGVPIYEAEPGLFDRFHSLAARRFFDTRKFRDQERDEIRDFIQRRRAGP